MSRSWERFGERSRLNLASDQLPRWYVSYGSRPVMLASYLKSVAFISPK